MPDALRQEQISASAFDYWVNEFPLSVTTIFPGTQIGTSSLAEWLELWLDSWSRAAQRNQNLPLWEVSLTVHCFVKHTTDKGRVEQLADAVRGTLSQAVIPVKDFASSGSPVVGYLNLREPETRRLTRDRLNRAEHSLQQLAVKVRGLAQGIA